MRTWLPILITGVALAACTRESPAAAATATAAPSATAPPTAHAASVARLDQLAATAEPAAAASMRTIVGRLEYEAGHRPSTALRAEHVLATLTAAGVQVVEQKQYIALAVRASYCVGGQTADGLAVAVCEYDSPAAATTGRDFVTTRFVLPAVARDIHVRGSTTLALSSAKDHPLTDARRRAERAFQTM